MSNKDYVKAKILLEEINNLRKNFDQLYRNSIASAKYSNQGKWDQNFANHQNKNIRKQLSTQEPFKQIIQEMIRSKFQELANHIRLLAEAIDKKILIITKTVSISPSRNVSSHREASNYFDKNNSKDIIKQKSPQFGVNNFYNRDRNGSHQFKSFDIAVDHVRTQDFRNNKSKAVSLKSAAVKDIKTEKIASPKEDKYDQFLKNLEKQLQNRNSPTKYFDLTNQSHFENENNEGFIQNQHNFPFDQYPYERPNRPKIFDRAVPQVKNRVAPKVNGSQKSIHFGVGNQIEQQILSQKKDGQLKGGAFKINKKKSTQSSLKNCDTIDKKHRYQFLVKSLINQ